MHPWTAMSPLSPSSGAARGPGHQLRPPRRAPVTPEQRQRSLQSILEAALDIMSSLDDDDDDSATEEEGEGSQNSAESQPER
jgi:hypothetical protein